MRAAGLPPQPLPAEACGEAGGGGAAPGLHGSSGAAAAPAAALLLACLPLAFRVPFFFFFWKILFFFFVAPPSLLPPPPPTNGLLAAGGVCVPLCVPASPGRGVPSAAGGLGRPHPSCWGVAPPPYPPFSVVVRFGVFFFFPLVGFLFVWFFSRWDLAVTGEARLALNVTLKVK